MRSLGHPTVDLTQTNIYDSERVYLSTTTSALQHYGRTNLPLSQTNTPKNQQLFTQPLNHQLLLLGSGHRARGSIWQ